MNGSAGARTQVSGLFVAVLTVLMLLFLAGLFQDLPEATLGAVVIAALIELVDIASLRDPYRTYTSRPGQIYGLAARADFIAAVAALRVESGLFFANADHIRAAIQQAATADQARAIVLDCETIPFIDVTAARMLNQLTPEMKSHGVRLVVARDIGQVRDMLALADQASSAPQYFGHVQEAVNTVRPGRPGVSGKEA